MDVEPSPLHGRVIAVPEARQLDVLATLLERRGAAVVRCPLVGIRDHPDQAAVRAWLERLIADLPALVIFYTGEGVERLHESAARAGIDAAFRAALARTPILTRGPKPKRALQRLELAPQFAAPAPTTDGLIAALGALDVAGKRVAVQLYSADQDRALVEHLTARGARVDCVAPYVYASAADDAHVLELIAALGEGRIDAIAFTSKSQIQRLMRIARERQLEGELRAGLARTKVAAVGPVVAAELAAAAVRVDTMPSDSFTMKPLVTSLGGLFAV
jgi:uroporphyrinogen-III synthase